MAFTVDDFHDLLRLLEQHPEWQAELRRHVLSTELLELPALVRQIAEQLGTLTARVDALAEAQTRTEARVEALAEAQARTEARLEALTARLDTLVEQVAALREDFGSETRWLRGEVGTIKGWALETRYRTHAPGYFGRIARRVRVVDPTALVDQLDVATDQGVLTEPEREALLLADIVLTGQRHADHQDVYLLVEVLGGIGPYDVQRAVDRAVVLAKLDRPALPVVAGERITEEGSELARKRGVWQVLDGQTVAPGAA